MTDQAPEDERRQFPRIPPLTEVWVRHDSGHRTHVKTRDLSRGGLCLESPDNAFDVGDKLNVEIRLPGDKKPVEAPARDREATLEREVLLCVEERRVAIGEERRHVAFGLRWLRRPSAGLQAELPITLTAGGVVGVSVWGLLALVAHRERVLRELLERIGEGLFVPPSVALGGSAGVCATFVVLAIRLRGAPPLETSGEDS